MKRILLTTTALTLSAGIAAAEVTFGGDAELQWNSDDDFTYGVGLTVSAEQELDNGLTVTGSLDVDLLDDDDGDTGTNNTFDLGGVTTSDWVLGLKSDTASLTFGDVAPSADSHWSGVTNMNEDAFNDEGDLGEDAVLKGEVSFGSTTVSASYTLDGGELDNMQFAAVSELGAWTVGAAYQEDNSGAATPGNGEVFGLFAKGEVGGATVHLAYADDDGDTSTGIGVSYPVGDVTLGAFYVMEDVGDDNYGVSVDYASGPLTVGAFYHDGGDEDYGLSVAYDMGNGITLMAGTEDVDGSWIGAEYDLGGGASVALTHTEDDDGDDETGPNDWESGTSLTVSFSF